ncbi:hypothetical protein QBC32DRAFT_177446, partial [Pseudoneurospora amorphoporcata]
GLFRVPVPYGKTCDRASGDPRSPSPVLALPRLIRPAIALENGDAVAVAVGRPLRAALEVAKTSFTSKLGRRENF